MTGISKEIYEAGKKNGIAEGKAIGIEEGKAIGLEANIIAILKDCRISPEEISEILGVPLDYVLELKKRQGI